MNFGSLIPRFTKLWSKNGNFENLYLGEFLGYFLIVTNDRLGFYNWYFDVRE